MVVRASAIRNSVGVRSACGATLLRWVLLLVALTTAAVSARAEPAWLLPLDGAIGPASSDYVRNALRDADRAQAPLVVLRIDTPGGLDSAMREIIAAILDSPVPVACLVGPGGARAASAGTYILYACHIAAMAPTTHLGAATPVAVGGPGMPGGQDKQQDKEKEDESQQPSASERKTLNDAVAYIRSLAERRGRNAEWAERAVRDAATLTAREALENNVIDLIASTPEELLRAIDGRTVSLPGGERQLATAGLTLSEHQPNWRQRFLATITDPNVAYILMLIGIYGLLLEFYNPGAMVPGTVGAISLLVALYAFQIMPVSYIGLGLIVLGIGLLAAEMMVPSVGVLGIGGVIAFLVGSIMLLDRDIPGYRIALPLILALTVATAAGVLAVVGMALRARSQPGAGSNVIVGAHAVAVEDFDTDGWVRLQGELWHAHSQQPVKSGQKLVVHALDGLTVHVHPVNETETRSAP